MAKNNSKNRMSKKNRGYKVKKNRTIKSRKNKSIKNKSKKIKSIRKKQHKGGSHSKYYTTNSRKPRNLSTSKMSPFERYMHERILKVKELKHNHPDLNNEEVKELSYHTKSGQKLEKEFQNLLGGVGANELRRKGNHTTKQEAYDRKRAMMLKTQAAKRAFNRVDYPRARAVALKRYGLRQAGNYNTRFNPQNLTSEMIMEQIKKTQQKQNNQARMSSMLDLGLVSGDKTNVIVEKPKSTIGKLRNRLKRPFWSKKPKASKEFNLFGENIFGKTEA